MNALCVGVEVSSGAGAKPGVVDDLMPSSAHTD